MIGQRYFHGYVKEITQNWWSTKTELRETGRNSLNSRKENVSEINRGIDVDVYRSRKKNYTGVCTEKNNITETYVAITIISILKYR